MGNAEIRPQKWDDRPREPVANDSNGIYGLLKSEETRLANTQLPPAAAGLEPGLRWFIVPNARFGRVRIFFELTSYSHYRNKFWRWGVIWADAVDEAGNIVQPSLPRENPLEVPADMWRAAELKRRKR